MIHFTNAQKITSICQKHGVNWQTKPRILKLLKFNGNPNSLEKVRKEIEKLIEEIKKQVVKIERTFENYE